MRQQADKDPLVIIDGVGTMLLPLSEATNLMTALLRGQRVEYSWSEKCYKFAKDNEQSLVIKSISQAQIAQLHLESDT